MIDMERNHSANEPIAFDESLDLAKTLMDEALSSTPLPFRPRTEYLTEAPGKFLRAYALIACAEEESGVRPSAAKAAAAVELLHLATLVHDDVIDNAGTRRGLTTLMKKFGAHQAVITGDYIFCLALRLAAEAAANERDTNEDFPRFMEKICMGELLQSINHRNFSLNGYGYLRIIAGKTAALFEGSFLAGAMLGETSRPEAKKYAAIGWHLGMIFQLTDDCMDYEATAEQAKKPVLSDFVQGVVTLPLIVAMKNKPEIRDRACAGNITKDEIRQSVMETGGLAFTRRISKMYYDRAMRRLDGISAPARKKEKLGELLYQAMVGSTSRLESTAPAR
jgi:heptaprenyl diphosphate synthase